MSIPPVASLNGPTYQIASWGEPVGSGELAPVNVQLDGIAKAAKHPFSHAVAAERICTDLAQALKLPVAQGIIVQDNAGTHYYVSINFCPRGTHVPEANAKLLASNDPVLSCGIILFDMWIYNGDRHAANLYYDVEAQSVVLFDHSHSAFFNACSMTLDSIETRTGIGNHCLVDYVTDKRGFAFWHDRIMSIPEYYIRETLLQAVGINALTGSQAHDAANFLLHRRTQLLDIVNEACDSKFFQHL